jgi:hypothetical protein
VGFFRGMKNVEVSAKANLLAMLAMVENISNKIKQDRSLTFELQHETGLS